MTSQVWIVNVIKRWAFKEVWVRIPIGALTFFAFLFLPDWTKSSLGGLPRQNEVDAAPPTVVWVTFDAGMKNSQFDRPKSSVGDIRRRNELDTARPAPKRSG
jgi:hypothetical protein